MFRYYFTLGLRSLRRNPMLTALMVVTLAVGVAASMATFTVLYVMSGDPIPGKSDRLFVPRLDNAPLTGFAEGDEPSDQMTYIDANNLLASGQGVRRTAVYGITTAIESGRADLPPFLVQGVAPTRDFFAMFQVPFLHGSAWSAADETARKDVVVLSRETSEKLFGKINPVGKRIRMEDAEWQVVGVVDTWNPLPRYYRLINGNGGSFTGAEALFIPFQTAVRHEMGNSGNNNCNGAGPTEPGWQGWIKSECDWIQFWFEGESAADQSRLKEFLGAYVTEQKKLGRYPRPVNVRLENVMEWMQHLGVVSADAKLSTWLAFGFLLVCLVNTVGLLLAKFSARAGEVGVRRALGATRTEIFHQYLIEAAVIGLVGGLLGLLLSFGGLWLISLQSDEMATLAKMDWAMLALTLSLSLVASILAGLLPTWRACQVTPALQLKTQ
ncbi:MAG: ABC transporter permease [Arenimonas sp.]|nr:ABC transporter permease [Arenimonas sp.]MBP8097918.1 ABC transporter permease [Arenimonas sp.]